jgi:enamine deaminase RidA (YjgF/YER057c/UK114 family)
MNEVWDAWVPADEPPARATVQARLAKPEYRIEIQAIAAV